MLLLQYSQDDLARLRTRSTAPNAPAAVFGDMTSAKDAPVGGGGGGRLQCNGRGGKDEAPAHW